MIIARPKLSSARYGRLYTQYQIIDTNQCRPYSDVKTQINHLAWAQLWLWLSFGFDSALTFDHIWLWTSSASALAQLWHWLWLSPRKLNSKVYLTNKFQSLLANIYQLCLSWVWLSFVLFWDESIVMQ